MLIRFELQDYRIFTARVIRILLGLHGLLI